MAAIESRASWHPAFMPNAVSDLLPPHLYQNPSTNLAPKESSTTHPNPFRVDSFREDSEADSQYPTKSMQHVAAERTNLRGKEHLVDMDREDHPPVNNLRSALTTSLTTRRGVEMDESPMHADAIADEMVEGVFDGSTNPGKVKLPSEKPAHEPGHASSASFARTVPRDMDWGEDDEVDPELNLQRTETDPFELMAKTERTNSFPQVPPAHNPTTSSFGYVFPQSQAGEIVSRIEHAGNMLSQDGSSENFLGHVGGSDVAPYTDISALETGFLEGSVEGKDQGLAYGGEVPTENEEDLRYEEGLPLVDDSQQIQHQTRGSGSAAPDTFAENDPSEEDDFFGGLAGPASSKVPPHLGRKSTMQVISALHFPSPEDGRPSPLEIDETGHSQNPFGNAIGERVGASETIVMPKMLGGFENHVSSQDKDQTYPHPEPTAEDLAAKWQAALAGDDLLDDEDELLDEDSMPQGIAVDPAGLFGSDDEGFLDDDDVLSLDQHNAYEHLSPPLHAPVTGSDGRTSEYESLASAALPQRNNSSSKYLPPNTTQSPIAQTGNSFTPNTPLFTDLSTQPSRNPLPHGSSYGFGGAPVPPYGAPQQLRPELVKSQSFADKSKGGYSSPYDLPMEVVKPRKRTSMQQMARGYSHPTPPSALPPRSSSMATQGPPNSGFSVSPPVVSPSFPQAPTRPFNLPAATPQQVVSPSLNSSAGFFAELPVAARPKPSGRYPPQPSPSVSRDQGFQVTPPNHHPLQPHVSQATLSVQGLVSPPKVSPFAPLPTTQPPPPVVTSRYSPASAIRQGTVNVPPPLASGSRYATAPPSQQQQPPPYASAAPVTSPPASILAHQPRTSSPLIHFERASDHQSISGLGTESANVSLLRRESSDFEQAPRAYPSQGRMSPSKRTVSNYAPDPRANNQYYEPAFAPPQRSQTQSPGKVMAGSRVDIGVGEPYQRPVSVHSPTSPRQANEQFPLVTAGASRTRTRAASQGVNYIAPTDGREHDPLQRWRGGPVIAWGVGGIVITSFPREVPRYGMGQTKPMIICSPGEVKVRSLKDIYPLEGRLSGFPGPLKGKFKKKEVIAWLTAGIDLLERENIYLRSRPVLTHEDKRKEERLLLWKILRVMVENDGLLEGNPLVEKAVRGVLSPGLDGDETAAIPQYSTGSDMTGALRAAMHTTVTEPVSPAALDQLRNYLLRGEREKAVWEAVDKRLWAHALLISNTLSKDIHKQVAQEFIQKEVKGAGENTESLAALYEIFAGNFEESVDELVPPSARAGLQMISTSNISGSSKSALDGLDRWRETLGLVLSNRSSEDVQAITALGKLLSGYGRAEAAHICFLFARGFSVFGGADDPSTNIVLVGSDHLRQTHEFDKELEPTLLSEVYEYGLSLSGTSNVSFSAPHLAAYKLQHACILAQFGQRDKALQYCEVIANSIGSQVRRSPYHHALLISALEDLSKRLKQSPKDESSSWIPKPSIDKVSGSLWGKFNKFVAGEEDGTAGGVGSEVGSEVGPFARIAGDTPVISRSPSNGDIYGSLSAAAPNGSIYHAPSTKQTSRYAPGGSYTPPTAQDPSLLSLHGSPPRVSYAQRRSQEETVRPEVNGPDRTIYGGQRESNDQISRSYPGSDSSLLSNSYGKPASPYLESSYTPQHIAPPINDQYTPLASHDLSHSGPASDGNAPIMGYTPVISNDYEIPSAGTREVPLSIGHGYQSSGRYDPSNGGGYEPPSSGGYEAPSYEPASMNDEPDSPIDTRRKKKSFMDDDDDVPVPSAAENKKRAPPKIEKSKAEKDREADEAFRKAAEADAKKDASSASPKKGWGLGGWFAKKDAAIDNVQPNKPIRAKLGEESSFVYDPDLGRWVNKKGGKDSTQAGSTATPPPPKAGPPRSISSSTAPELTSAPRPITGAAPPQRSFSAMATSTSFGQSESPPTLAIPPTLPVPMSRSVSNGSAASGPPSRPTTSMSNASSIDDLLGPPTARKGATKKTKKGRGYIDVMEKPAGA